MLHEFKAAPVTADSAFTKTDRSPVHTRAEMSDTMPFFAPIVKSLSLLHHLISTSHSLLRKYVTGI